MTVLKSVKTSASHPVHLIFFYGYKLHRSHCTIRTNEKSVNERIPTVTKYEAALMKRAIHPDEM